MRTLSAHLTQMDRQVQESLNIIQEIRKFGHCLNQKSEWAGSKIPDLDVRIPKGVAREKKTTITELDKEEEMDIDYPDQEIGEKRLREPDQETDNQQDINPRPAKIQREQGPDNQGKL